MRRRHKQHAVFIVRSVCILQFTIARISLLQTQHFATLFRVVRFRAIDAYGSGSHLRCTCLVELMHMIKRAIGFSNIDQFVCWLDETTAESERPLHRSRLYRSRSSDAPAHAP